MSGAGPRGALREEAASPAGGGVRALAEKGRERLHEVLWERDPASLPLAPGVLIRAARIGQAVARDLSRGQLTLQAMSLVYTTLLALVPLLAVSFAMLKAFGVHNQLEDLLLGFLAPLGDKGAELSGRIIGFVDNMKVGVLGSVGLAVLLYTVVSTVHKIERALNDIWRVASSRPLLERFSGYLSVVVIGPVFVFTALGLTATVTGSSTFQQIAAIEPFGVALRAATRAVPYVLVIAAFTFVYAYIPNTRVRLRAALAGAVVAGLLWQSAGWAFAAFVVGSTKYTAIYSSFAILIFFLIWLYVAWLILLVGASVAFYVQHPEHVGLRGPLTLSNRLKERLALAALAAVARHFYGQGPACTGATLARRLEMPLEPVSAILETLEKGGLIAEASGDAPVVLPARDPAQVRLRDALDVVRAAGDEPPAAAAPGDEALERTLATLEEAYEKALGGVTWKDLVESR